MKKALLTFTALSMSVAVSACAMHPDSGQNNGYTQSGTPPQNSWNQQSWDHKEHMRMMAEEFFNEMDKNGDGVVTRKEYNEYAREWFRQADTNHDGKLTLEEVKAQLKREKMKMKSGQRNHDSMYNNGAMDQSGMDTSSMGNENDTQYNTQATHY